MKDNISDSNYCYRVASRHDWILQAQFTTGVIGESINTLHSFFDLFLVKDVYNNISDQLPL
jgi:hypothetical protein